MFLFVGEAVFRKRDFLIFILWESSPPPQKKHWKQIIYILYKYVLLISVWFMKFITCFQIVNNSYSSAIHSRRLTFFLVLLFIFMF